jgi:hypothetical protein
MASYVAWTILTLTFLFTGVSGFDNSEVLSGRPYGDCTNLWRTDISTDIRVTETNSRRMCATRI